MISLVRETLFRTDNAATALIISLLNRFGIPTIKKPIKMLIKEIGKYEWGNDFKVIFVN